MAEKEEAVQARGRNWRQAEAACVLPRFIPVTAGGGSKGGAEGAPAPLLPKTPWKIEVRRREKKRKERREEEERGAGGRRREMSPPKKQILDPPLLYD